MPDESVTIGVDFGKHAGWISLVVEVPNTARNLEWAKFLQTKQIFTQINGLFFHVEKSALNYLILDEAILLRLVSRIPFDGIHGSPRETTTRYFSFCLDRLDFLIRGVDCPVCRLPVHRCLDGLIPDLGLVQV